MASCVPVAGKPVWLKLGADGAANALWGSVRQAARDSAMARKKRRASLVIEVIALF